MGNIIDYDEKNITSLTFGAKLRYTEKSNPNEGRKLRLVSSFQIAVGDPLNRDAVQEAAEKARLNVTFVDTKNTAPFPDGPGQLMIFETVCGTIGWMAYRMPEPL